MVNNGNLIKISLVMECQKHILNEGEKVFHALHVTRSTSICST